MWLCVYIEFRGGVTVSGVLLRTVGVGLQGYSPYYRDREVATFVYRLLYAMTVLRTHSPRMRRLCVVRTRRRGGGGESTLTHPFRTDTE